MARDLGHVGAIRNGQWLEAARSFRRIMTCNVCALTRAESLQGTI